MVVTNGHVTVGRTAATGAERSPIALPVTLSVGRRADSCKKTDWGENTGFSRGRTEAGPVLWGIYNGWAGRLQGQNGPVGGQKKPRFLVIGVHRSLDTGRDNIMICMGLEYAPEVRHLCLSERRIRRGDLRVDSFRAVPPQALGPTGF